MVEYRPQVMWLGKSVKRAMLGVQERQRKGDRRTSDSGGLEEQQENIMNTKIMQ